MNREDCHIEFMKKALNEASIAYNEDEIPVGAIIVCQGKIIARAHNQTERLNDVTAHAEILAITAACNRLGGKYLTDCTLYVTMEPCVMCAGALAWAQIGAIVYGASDPKRGYARVTPSILHPKTQVISGVMADECSLIVKNFFTKKR
jgi:tRNA(adenine34) deaminase